MSNTCIAFGVFDGVHEGHKAVISKLMEMSVKGYTPVVVSFEYDTELLQDKKVLSTEMEKEHLIGRLGPELMISYKIDKHNKDSDIKSFIRDVLVESLGAKVIVAGKNDCNIMALRECLGTYRIAVLLRQSA